MAQSKPNRKKYSQCIQLKGEDGKPTGKVKTVIHTLPHKKA